MKRTQLIMVLLAIVLISGAIITLFMLTTPKKGTKEQIKPPVSMNERVKLSLDKKSYSVGEKVTINLTVTNKNAFQNNPLSFRFFRLKNGKWEELTIHTPVDRTEGREEHCYKCTNGQLQFLCEIAGMTIQGYHRLANYSFTWDQKHVVIEERTCGNTTYLVGIRKQVPKGTYKVRIDYVLAKSKNDFFKDPNLITEEKFVEVEFKIE